MILAISDSHLPHRAENIPDKVWEEIEEADTVIHCGDFETQKVYRELESASSNFYGVQGNCDRFETEKYIDFEKKDYSIGVTHGTGIHPRGDHDTLVNIAEKMGVEILFHGHTHKQEALEHKGKILLNPGSCTGVPGGSSRSKKPSYMKVELSPGEVEVTVYELENGTVLTEDFVFDI